MNSEKQSTNLQMTLREVNRVGERQKNVPKIRFKGYEDAWEQRKLEEFLKERTERAEGDEELLSVTINKGVIRQLESDKKNNSSENKSNYKLVYKGDIPYNSMRMWQGAVGVSQFEGIVSPAYTVLIPTEEADGKFLMELFKKSSSLQIFTRWSQGLTSDTWNLKYPTLSKISFFVPYIKEQNKIAKLLQELDDLITLHQRKYDALKSMKKTLLSKMFPKNGEDVPEIRFKGFTDAWEQRKLGQVLDFSLKTNSLSRSMLNYEEGELKNIHYGDILMDYCPILNFKTDTIPYITEGKVEEFTSQLLMNGDVVFADAAEDESVGKAIEINGLEEQCLVSGLHTIVGRPTIKFAERFLGYYINSNSYHNQLLPLMQGTKVSSISKTTLQKTMIIYPKVNSEQLKIGSFFYCLESIITLHQRKLDELKNMKKTLLQQMFV